MSLKPSSLGRSKQATVSSARGIPDRIQDVCTFSSIFVNACLLEPLNINLIGGSYGAILESPGTTYR